MKLLVAQLCRAKDHETINEDAECEWSENAMQFSHHHCTFIIPKFYPYLNMDVLSGNYISKRTN